jgi:hypothetical protein
MIVQRNQAEPRSFSVPGNSNPRLLYRHRGEFGSDKVIARRQDTPDFRERRFPTGEHEQRLDHHHRIKRTVSHRQRLTLGAYDRQPGSACDQRCSMRLIDAGEGPRVMLGKVGQADTLSTADFQDA